MPADEQGPGITLPVENYEDNYTADRSRRWGRHPPLEAAVEFMRVPADVRLEISL